MNVAQNPVADTSASTSNLLSEPWSPALGVRISGYRYAGGPVPQDVQNLVRNALYHHGVVVFEPETVNAETYAEFASFLGEIVNYSGEKIIDSKGVKRSGFMVDSKLDDYLRNHIWHTDGGFNRNPPSFTGLFALEVPGLGGDTMFSNATKAYENFDLPFREYLDSLTAVTLADASGHMIRIRDADDRTEALAKYPPHEEPLIRVHPATGRKQIAVNESYTHYIKGLSRTASQHLLNILFDSVKRPEITARLSWREGIFALWDNRVVQHRVIKDYGSSSTRRLYRVTVRDDRYSLAN